MADTPDPAEYGSRSITVLRGLDPVRQRPGMYAGNVYARTATHHLLYEVFDNAVDEALAGHATRIDVTLHADGSAEIADNGRGIPVDIHPDAGISAAEVVLTTLHAGGKFDNDSYSYSGGLHGVGISVTNALSDWLCVEIRRDGGVDQARFERGVTASSVRRTKAMAKGAPTGTTIRFKPDASILREPDFEAEDLVTRFHDVACLNDGLEIVFTDARGTEASTRTFRFTDGMADFVSAIVAHDTSATSGLLFAPARFQGSHASETGGRLEVDVALSWTGSDRDEDVRAYCNNIPQADGGQHVTGLRSALVKTLLAHGQRAGMIRKSSRLSPEDLREGLVAALHVRLPDPAFSSQTKEKLISTEARSAVEAVLGPALDAWLDTHPEEARSVIARAQAASEARIAARKARELSRTQKTGTRVSSAALPEKLADCASRRTEARELFLVEGDSAGGSAKQGRDRDIQAILPLRGKILNVERAKTSQVLKNAEIAAMVQTLGAGIGEKMDLGKLRYGKVVIMTDADVDGAHIATLILTFFFRQMRPLVDAGHLYLAVPPLYRLRRKGEEDLYVRSDRALAGLFLDRALSSGAITDGGERLSGAGARDALVPLIDAEPALAPAARLLSHPALADALLGCPDAAPLFATAPISRPALKRITRALGACLETSDPEAQWRLEITGDGTGYGVLAHRTEDGLTESHRVGAADLAAWQVERVRHAFHAQGLGQMDLAVAGVSAPGPIGLAAGLRAAGAKGASVSRYKGLGEMNPEELWETTMDPARRVLHRVSAPVPEVAETVFSDLMADNVAARRRLIEEMCAGGGALDI